MPRSLPLMPAQELPDPATFIASLGLGAGLAPEARLPAAVQVPDQDFGCLATGAGFVLTERSLGWHGWRNLLPVAHADLEVRDAQVSGRHFRAVFVPAGTGNLAVQLAVFSAFVARASITIRIHVVTSQPRVAAGAFYYADVALLGASPLSVSVYTEGSVAAISNARIAASFPTTGTVSMNSDAIRRLFCERYLAETPYRDICRELGISKRTAGNWAREMGLPRRNGGPRRERWAPGNKRKIG
jgi:hypothetical protein